MGYEHRIVIVERHAYEGNKVDSEAFGFEIARFDLSRYDESGETYTRYFTIPIDFEIYVNNEDPNKVYPSEYWKTDMYGEHCKYTTVENAIEWLNLATGNRRARLLLAFLRQLQELKSDYGELCVVHYGY